jgi:hypothetical protein
MDACTGRESRPLHSGRHRDKFGAEQVDHLVEVADGSTNDLSNLASCHGTCHERKHRDPEWAQERVELALSVLGRRAG